MLGQAKDRGFALMVIGSPGKSGLAQCFAGSVARNVLKKARCF